MFKMADTGLASCTSAGSFAPISFNLSSESRWVSSRLIPDIGVISRGNTHKSRLEFSGYLKHGNHV